MRLGRPPRARLGLNRLAALLVSLQVACLVGVAEGFRRTGLSYDWSELWSVLSVVAALVVAWLYYVLEPGKAWQDWLTGEACLHLALVLSFGLIVGPGQYAAAALRRPLVDETLARADALLGINVPAVVEWTRAHPAFARLLMRAYVSLLPQLFLPVFVLGFWYRDRTALWEYGFHFHVALVVTLSAFALWPAACAFTYYGFESILAQDRFIRIFGALRAGTLTTVTLTDMEGLVSCPSFHVAGAVLATWALRGHRWWLVALLPLNGLLIIATVMLGLHYATDLLATAVMLAGSLAAYRWLKLAEWTVPAHLKDATP